MSNPIRGRRIVLGVSGSIAAYKGVELASKLTQADAEVDAILTSAACQFVSALSFQSVTGRRAYVDEDLWGCEGHVLHVGLARHADSILIAPATANTLARLAHGLADNLLSLTALAASCPLVLAPAMDAGMFHHPATQENLARLRQRGALVIGPVEGHLASGLYGPGRMEEPLKIVEHLRFLFSRQGVLQGRKVVVTAGGTQEPIDAVRVITNRSSGKQGFALAQAALDWGAQVTLITAPSALSAPVGIERVDVSTAEEMHSAVMRAIEGADALLMAAAVADFKPAQVQTHKIKKGAQPLDVHLVPTVDILRDVAAVKQAQGWPRLTVGFAAESSDLIENARTKLLSKRLDLIVANDISAPDAGFGVDTNRVTLLFADGRVESLPLMSKAEVAEEVLRHVAARLTS